MAGLRSLPVDFLVSKHDLAIVVPLLDPANRVPPFIRLMVVEIGQGPQLRSITGGKGVDVRELSKGGGCPSLPGMKQ